MKNNLIVTGMAVVKGAAVFAALALFAMLLNNAAFFLTKLPFMDKYGELKSYVHVAISPDDTSEEGMRRLDEHIASFFQLTNRDMGTLFSLSSQLESFNHPVRSFVSREDLELLDYVVSVNNNYLAQNPVLGLNGKPVFADETAKALTILLPEKYKASEKQLLDRLIPNFTTRYYLAADGMKNANTAVHEPLPVQVIYIQNGQRSFMYDFTQRRHINEYIQEPILSVVTVGNAFTSQLPHYLTTGKYRLNISAPGAMEQVNEFLNQSGLASEVLAIENSYVPIQLSLTGRLKASVMQLGLALLGLLLSVWLSRRLFLRGLELKTTLAITGLSALCVLLVWPKTGLLLSAVLLAGAVLVEWLCRRLWCAKRRGTEAAAAVESGEGG